MTSSNKRTRAKQTVKEAIDGAKKILKAAARNPNAAQIAFHAADTVLILTITEMFLNRRFKYSYTPTQVALDLWNRFWLTGLMPLVLTDSMVRSATGWMKDPKNPDDNGPFCNIIRDYLNVDWKKAMTNGEPDWKPLPYTRGILGAQFCVLAGVAIETLKGAAAMVSGFGEVIPG